MGIAADVLVAAMTNARSLAEKIAISITDEIPVLSSNRKRLLVNELESILSEALAEAEIQWLKDWNPTVEAQIESAEKEARAAAYEEAAKIAELHLTNHTDSRFNAGFQFAVAQIAANIRLSGKLTNQEPLQGHHPENMITDMTTQELKRSLRAGELK